MRRRCVRRPRVRGPRTGRSPLRRGSHLMGSALTRMRGTHLTGPTARSGRHGGTMGRRAMRRARRSMTRPRGGRMVRVPRVPYGRMLLMRRLMRRSAGSRMMLRTHGAPVFQCRLSCDRAEDTTLRGHADREPQPEDLPQPAVPWRAVRKARETPACHAWTHHS